MPKINYKEGDWFAVPLRTNGYATGVIARANPKGALLGFFFGPKRSSPPSLAEVAGLEPADAVLVAHFGHLGLLGQTWPILGSAENWERERWSATQFGHRESLTGRLLKVVFDDDDPNRELRRVPVSADEFDQLPRSGASGAGAVEIVLTKLLG